MNPLAYSVTLAGDYQYGKPRAVGSHALPA
jgi:hypothetical protein